MLKLRRVKVLHIEPTDVCQAACPLCAREINPDFNKSDAGRHLRVEHIQRLYPERVIKGLDKVFMCGDYGDPAAGKYTLDLYRYFRSMNPNVILGMNSNVDYKQLFGGMAWARYLINPKITVCLA